MRSGLALLALMLVPAIVAAQDIRSHTQAFTLFCVGEASTGFDKVQGTWTEQRFKPSNYIVKKTVLLANDPFAAYDPWCDDPRTGEPPTKDGVSTTSVGCYSFAEPGEQTPLTSNCRETWGGARDASSTALTWLKCDGGQLFEFRINLETLDYVRTAIYAFAMTNPDSLVLEIGKCSFIE